MPQRRGKRSNEKSYLKGESRETPWAPQSPHTSPTQRFEPGQLADMTGLRRDTIAHLENGREDPQPYHLRLLARALDVPELELVS